MADAVQGQPPRVHIRLCGTFSVSVDRAVVPATELGSRRGRQLLLLLAIERGRTLSTDSVADALWPDEPPRDPARGVASLVSRLRKVLGSGAVVGARGSYRLGDPPGVEVDLDVVATFLAEAVRRVAPEPGLAAAAAERALDILAAGALADEPSSDWADASRAEHAAMLHRARLLAASSHSRTGGHARAIELAAASSAAQPLDEEAARVLMTVLDAADRPADALLVYDRLRTSLAEELGTDPAGATSALQLAILRAEPRSVEPTASASATAADADRLPGRASELAGLLARWSEAAAGRPGTVVVVGESGIGKTRLAEELASVARSTGGLVLRTRCHESERSLFLQPVADALRPTLAALTPAALAGVVADDAAGISVLLPDIGRALGTAPLTRGTDDFRRRLCFDALVQVVRRLTDRGPVLLLVDDIHNARHGTSTLEWLHFLARIGPTGGEAARVLVVTTARIEEATAVRRHLGGVAVELRLGPIDREAVHSLATRAGHPELTELTERIVSLTNGHPLYVQEILSAVGAGSGDIPESLQASVLERVARTGPECEGLLRAGAVVGADLTPDLLAGLLDIPVSAAVQRCERALEARLLVVVDSAYGFAHDIVRDVLYASTPMPTRIVHHRLAADLLTDRPEVVARHAAAAGDRGRAARAWLRAAEQALDGLAAADAVGLATNALEAATARDEADLRARALLARGRAHETVGEFADARADLLGAVDLARRAGDRRLEMVILRELGGNVSSALGLSTSEYTRHLEEGLVIAESLGDRPMQVDLLARLAVVDTNRLRFRSALALAERALAAARGGRDERALSRGLDAVKTVHAYLGDVAALGPVLDEIEPLLVDAQDLWLLQWVVFERSVIHLAAGEFAAARQLMSDALAISAESGYLSNEAWYLTHLAWAARMQGDIEGALALGESSVERALTLDHAWWSAAAMSGHATTLLLVGRHDEAVTLLERALPYAEATAAEGYLLRCLAPLAQATGSRDVLERADRLLAGAECPPMRAWLLGADAYLSLASAWLRIEPERAGRVLAPLVTAADRCGWDWLARRAERVLEG